MKFSGAIHIDKIKIKKTIIIIVIIIHLSALSRVSSPDSKILGYKFTSNKFKKD